MDRIIIVFIFIVISHTYAWLYPEHRDIAVLAIQALTPHYRELLDELWSEARIGHESRLSESVIDTIPGFIDYAS